MEMFRSSLPGQRRIAPLAAALSSALALSALPLQPAVANTINVANCNNTGSGSLRAALAAANSSDTVSLTTLSACTITLTTAALPVAVNNLKVLGPVNNSVTIDAGQNYRVFEHSGAGTLTLDHLVITGGKYKSSSAPGGCVKSGGSVALHSTTMSGCVAYGTAGKAWGAAIFAANTVTLVNSTITGNLTEAPNGAYGGAVFAKNIDIQYSTVGGNSAQNPDGVDPALHAKFQGGGVFVSTGTASIVHSHIDDNQVLGDVTNGGGVFTNGDLYLGASSVSNNRAYCVGRAEGGGVFTGGALTVVHSVVSGNFAGANGGAYGGGLRAGSVVANYATVSGNSVEGGPGGFGGLFEGAGMFVYQGATMINNSTIDNNTALGTGGGIFGFHSNITLNNSTVSGNYVSGFGAVDAGSGGITMASNAGAAAKLTLFNSTIAFNSVFKSSGTYSAAGVRAYGTMVSQSSIIANNTKHGDPSDLSCDCGTNAAKKISGNNNLVMSIDAAGVTPPAGMVIVTADPKLVPLGNHGGETRTHALPPGSPAIGVGNNLGNFTTDQRGIGYPRLNAGAADIGAYERQPNDDEIFYNAFQ